MGGLKKGLMALIAGASIVSNSIASDVKPLPTPQKFDLEEKCEPKEVNFHSVKEYLQCHFDYLCNLAWESAGFQGGNISRPKEIYREDSFEFSVNNSRGKLMFPTLDEIRDQFKSYIQATLPWCEDRVSLEYYGMSFGDPKIEIEFGENETVTTLNMPITITNGNKNLRLEKLVNRIPLKFLKIHRVAEKLNREYSKRGGVDLTYLDSQEGLKFEICADTKGVTLFVVKDPGYLMANDEPYNFMFVADFREPGKESK